MECPVKNPFSRLFLVMAAILMTALACSDQVVVGPAATMAPAPTVEILGDEAVVTRVIDGDSVEVALAGAEYRLRYVGIDTPERGQPFYQEAADANERLVGGQRVILVTDISDTDRFGRLLRYVYLPDGTFVNGELVRLGLAQAKMYRPDVAFHEMLAGLESEARAARRGMWAP